MKPGKQNISRRQFFNASALTGVGVFIGAADGETSARAAVEGQTVRVPEAQIPVVAEADVVVVGGGPAGFGAAMRAARSGVNTLLIERFGGPGGAATSGYMCVTGEGGTFPLHSEWVKGLSDEGWLFDAWKAYPQLPGNVLVHQSGRRSFYPDDGAYVMIRMLEKANVRLLFRTLFVHAIVQPDQAGEGSIEAIVVENASGRQAVKGKVFIDATGRADVVARAGAPFKSAGNDQGLPVPFSLMYKVSGVEYEKLFNYQKSDPALWAAIAKARAAGDIPEGLYMPYQYTVGGGWGGYSGCPQLNMCALRGNGEMLIWSFSPFQWGLNPSENGFDASRGEVEMRKFNIAEVKFLKKYVPGFENAYLSGMAPYMALREGRHPLGEYLLTRNDIINESKFPDAVLKRTLGDPADTSEARMPRVNESGELIRIKSAEGGPKPRSYTCDIPYRAFLPRKINNLLLAGECLSCTHDWFYGYRLIPWCMRTGEVAATAAVMAIKRGITPKAVKWATGYYSD
ncbi:MAG TPA: FAD-dependent oxidoreductase [Verrucomicrobiae bacterium]